MEPDRSRVHGKWISTPHSARGESSHQDHAQEKHSEQAVNDEEYEQDGHHCRGHQ